MSPYIKEDERGLIKLHERKPKLQTKESWEIKGEKEFVYKHTIKSMVKIVWAEA